jgi:hypothetical protein
MAERTFIRFTFLGIDPAWQRREGEPRAEDSHGIATGAGRGIATGAGRNATGTAPAVR